MAQSQLELTDDVQHISSSSSNTWDQQQLNQRDDLKVTDHPRIHFTGSNPRQSAISMLQPQYDNKSSRSKTSSLEQQLPFVSPSYAWQQHSMNLAQHIYQRGLLEGIGSDIVVKIPAWKGEYHLHRLVLDQNTYFQTLFQGGFRESLSSEIILHFEHHPYITADSFMFVLARLYGNVDDPDININNVQRLLATCSFFQLDSMSELCVEFILQSLSENTVIDYLLFADGHLVFGSDRICDAIFTFLCREAYAMDIDRLVDIPAAWLKKLLNADSLWVTSEYHRYQFIQTILQQRYYLWCQQNSSSINSEQHLQQPSPLLDHADYSSDEDDTNSTADLKFEQLSNTNYTPDSRYTNITPFSTPSSSSNTQNNHQSHLGSASNKKTQYPVLSKQMPKDADEMEDEDLCCILAAVEDIISHSIHYMHMTFEQLDAIRLDTNPFNGSPLVPDPVIKSALWNQIQMRSKIGMASGEDRILRMTTTTEGSPTNTKSSHKEATFAAASYAIPTNDITAYTGESTFLCSTLAPNRNPHHRTHQSLSSALSPPTQHQQYHHHRYHKLSSNDRQTSSPVISETPGPSTSNPTQYAQYPPFRFSVEFKDVASLRRNVRVYSKTVFYAGSNWNMYIQKTRSQRKGILQLGVYLHRQSIHHDNDQQQEQPNKHHHHHHQQDPICTDLPSFSLYSDKRLVTKTWFKIFCPSKSPKHTLTLFQSSPDDFSVLQSWGWRSTVLCADEVSPYATSAPIGSTSNPGSQQTLNSGITPVATNTASLDASSSTSLSSVLNMGNLSLAPYSQSPSPESINNEPTKSHTPTDMNKKPILSSAASTLRFSVVMGHV